MKWRCLLFLFFLCTTLTNAQSLIQTFVDRCTGEVKTIVIPFEGSTVVVFYNRSKSFTIQDVKSGLLQAWLEETYNWWRTISPCSINQATTTATQTTTANATQNATASASSSASSATQTNSPTGQTASSTNQSSNTDSQSSTGETNANSTEQQSEQTGGSESGNNESNQEGNGDSGDETSSEKEQSSESEENSESEGESEDNGDDSDDGEKSEEKDNKKSIKKSNPLMVAANVATMSSLDGSINFVTNIGLSQASLSGNTSYSLNAMIWDNLKQFNVNLGKTFIHKEPITTIYGYNGNKKTTGGSIELIETSSINFMYMYGAINLSYGKSYVWPLKKNIIAGTAITLMAMKYGNDYTVMPTTIGFTTKPYLFKRYTISPMFAIALSPVMYSSATNDFIYNRDAMFVIGSSNSFNLTKKFFVNLGFNIIESTADIPLTWGVTIGSRFQF